MASDFGPIARASGSYTTGGAALGEPAGATGAAAAVAALPAGGQWPSGRILSARAAHADYKSRATHIAAGAAAGTFGGKGSLSGDRDRPVARPIITGAQYLQERRHAERELSETKDKHAREIRALEQKLALSEQRTSSAKSEAKKERKVKSRTAKQLVDSDVANGLLRDLIKQKDKEISALQTAAAYDAACASDAAEAHEKTKEVTLIQDSRITELDLQLINTAQERDRIAEELAEIKAELDLQDQQLERADRRIKFKADEIEVLKQDKADCHLVINDLQRQLKAFHLGGLVGPAIAIAPPLPIAPLQRAPPPLQLQPPNEGKQEEEADGDKTDGTAPEKRKGVHFGIPETAQEKRGFQFDLPSPASSRPLKRQRRGGGGEKEDDDTAGAQ